MKLSLWTSQRVKCCIFQYLLRIKAFFLPVGLTISPFKKAARGKAVKKSDSSTHSVKTKGKNIQRCTSSILFFLLNTMN